MNRVIIFAAGLLIGVVSIVVFNRTDENRNADNVSLESGETTAQSGQPESPARRSPLAVVKEDPPEELSVASASNTETDQDLIQSLVDRLTDAELRIADLELALTNFDVPESQPDEPQGVDIDARLLEFGIDPVTVNEIKATRNKVQLQRLELRDRATREGWVDSDRFRESFTELNSSNQLRESLGDEDYDQLLLAEERNNRVRIDDVIDNSAADNAGIEAGDILYRYADERIFTFRDLRSATTSGTKDQPVTVQVVRDSTRMDFVLPRGPMGVTISAVSVDDTE